MFVGEVIGCQLADGSCKKCQDYTTGSRARKALHACRQAHDCRKGQNEEWNAKSRSEEYSPRHQREHAPAHVFTRVRGVAFGFRG
jgi:hypothetical protein